MHDLPVIAIVGRPNVGKSSFFNAVLGRRIAIVDPTAGVTRDRVSAETMYSGRSFELIDTGGIGLFDEAQLKEEVERQIAIAIDLADAVIFLVDVRDGRTPLDEEVAARLRKCGKPVVAVANKADTNALEELRHEFHPLGFGEPLAASATENKGIYGTLDRVFELLPETAGREDRDDEDEGGERRIRVAVVGRTNAGKSTLVNHLVDDERVIVSDVPGTTRDSVDVSFRIADREFTVVDTAGIRRKRAIQDSVEFYGQARAERAIRNADIVLLLVDSSCEISIVDKKIADLIVTSYKPCAIVVSKWDLVENSTTGEYGDYVADRLPGLHFAPITFISSLTGFNIESTFRLVGELYDQAMHRVNTAQINTVLEAAISRRAPQLRKSRLAKIYFGMQVDVGPPTILVFVNDIKLFNREYRRYLSNQFRKAFPFKEIPVKVAFRGKDRVGAAPPSGRSAGREKE